MSRDLVLELIDLSTGCIIADMPMSAQAWLELENKTGSLTRSDNGQIVDLSGPSAGIVASQFGVDIPCEFQIRARHRMLLDELPYKVHTGRELVLMLAGKKPFAMFVSDEQHGYHDDLIPERFFAPYVSNGTFMHRAIVSEVKGIRLTRVFYAVPDQSWRIEAWLLLRKTGDVVGWSEGFERMEGSLLGYDDWQNDVYIERVFRAQITHSIRD